MSTWVPRRPPSYTHQQLVGQVGPASRDAMDTGSPYGVRIIMIRHGETGAHARDDVEGPQGPRGLRQALGVANRLVIRQEAISAVYTTPLTCAVQTAEPIAMALDLLLCELPAPDYIHEPHPKGASSWSAWVRRMGECIDRITDRHRSGNVVLVCHRASIIAAEQFFLRASLEHVTVVVDHASITEWKHCPAEDLCSGDWRWQRLRHNDIAHRMFEVLE